MPKVIIDAGHGGSDIGDFYGRRSEKNDNLRLAFRVGRFLLERGIDTSYTRTSDQYLPIMERIGHANKIGGDLIVSIHRVASNTFSQVPVLNFFVGENDKLGEAVANTMGRCLSVCGYSEYKTIVDLELAFIKDTDMPAIIVELGYLQEEKEYDIVDNHFVSIAEEVADGIYMALVAAIPDHNEINNWDRNISSNYHYRISIGPYRDYNRVFEQQYVISRLGYETEIMKSSTGFIIQVGNYVELDEAVTVELSLRRCGYCTFIIRV